ncbi:MAG: rhomboid family intramembrane serine protease [Gemmatimonadota bacterium]|nr:MAG: rhomboid family intramembrane serine protease [Gemmatimonadota bacterium]
MSRYGSMSPGGLRFAYRMTPWVKRLMVANAVMFVIVWSGAIPFQLAIEYLAFDEAKVLARPWTIITYMFVHGGIFHVFMNMLFLFFFGPPLEERWGGKEFVKYYAICGIGGALFNLVFGEGVIIGASGAVYGVMLAYALNWPDSVVWIWVLVLLPIKAKYLVLCLGAISFFSAFGGAADGIAHFAHLGGLVVGYLYLKKGWQLQAHWESWRKRLRKRRIKVVPGGARTPSGPSKPDDEAHILEVVDQLLDKIAAQGLDSLTAEERRFLDEVSRRRQDQHQVH